MSESNANVQPITAEEVIRLSEEDLLMVGSVLASIKDIHAALGAEEERHVRTKSELTETLKQARQGFDMLVEALAQRYVKRPGRFAFRPDLGAFVASSES